MSIDDKMNNEGPEEDTVAMRAISGGDRKNDRPKQPRASDQPSEAPLDEKEKPTPGATQQQAAKEDISAKSPGEKGQTEVSAPASPANEDKKDQASEPASSANEGEKSPALEKVKEKPAVQPPKQPQMKKETSVSAVQPPKRPQANKNQAASIVPRRPKKITTAEKQEKRQVTPANIEKKTEEPLATKTTEKDIADMSTAAISKKEVEEQLAVEMAKRALAKQTKGVVPGLKETKKDIAEQPTTTMPEQKASAKNVVTEQPVRTVPEQKAPEQEEVKPPVTEEPQKDVADISTAAISKKEVEEQLAAEMAKRALAKQTGNVLPGPKEPQKDIADVSTAAISKKEVEEQLAVARAQKEASKQSSFTPHPEAEKGNGTNKKAVAVLPSAPELSRAAAIIHPEPLLPHRTRVNRMLMRKKRHERTKELAPRLVMVVAVILIVLTSLFSAGTGAAYAYYESQLPLLNGIADHSLFQTTNIYDRNGKLLYELYDQQLGRGRRTYVNYKDISPFLVDATVAIEDRSFWTNEGVDPVGIARASFALAQSGDVQGGGSTVTQQLIKKQLFDNEPRTFQLKMEEALLASGLTQQYPKWKIMEMYLNTVYYGNINYGAEAAAQDYFGLMPKCDKTRCVPAVAQLDLAQASMLAGLPQSPTYYAPIQNKPVALVRQKAVLQAMIETGKITAQQAQQAADEMAKYKFVSHFAQNRARTQAPHFVNYVIDQLTNLLGAQTLASGGFNVYTTLDLDLEKKVEQIVYNRLYQQQSDNYVGFYGILSRDKNIHNGAVVVMNPFNGEILAMNGSANYNMDTPELNGQVNAATAMRQPGSSMKPIVYATAFEMGWSPGMIVPDHKTVYPYLESAAPLKYYTPQNYDGTFHSSYPMTIRTAVANSFNIPAIDTLMYAGVPNVLNMAGRLGIPELANLPADKVGAALALGAKEVSLLHLTNAYATFANQGVHVPPTSILEITDNQGRALYKYNQTRPGGTQAIGSDVAFLVNSMLSDKAARYHEFGPGNPLEFDRPVAAKTGTTDNFKDNWTMGYTPHLAVGVWVGNSNNEALYNAIGITGAGPIFHDVMQYANQRYKLPADDFVKPKNVHAGTVSAVTGLVPRPGESTVTDWYIDGTLPTIQGSNYSVPISCSGKKCNKDNGNKDNNNGNNNDNGDNND